MTVLRALALTLLSAALVGAAAPAAPATNCRSVPRTLEETRTSRWLAPGVVQTRIVRGAPDPRDTWTVDVAVTATRCEARAVADRLAASGHGARIERIGPRAQDDPERGPLGFRVRVGRFATQAEADVLRVRLVAEGFASPRSVFEGEDGERTTGPWVINVLEVAPGLGRSPTRR